MDVTQIPFAKHTCIEKEDDHTLKLEATDVVQNHLGTIHASAQFTLAETQSGLYLQETFPELEGKVVGLLRDATVKYKNPATSDIYAVAIIREEAKERFLSQFLRKGHASIVVDVVVKTCDDILCMEGTFSWFVQKSIDIS